MEMIIAIGIGAWFVLIGTVSMVAVFRDYSKPSMKKSGGADR